MSNPNVKSHSLAPGDPSAAPPPPKDSNLTNGGPADENSSAEPEGGYPPQKHAGAVGLGPEYGKNHSVTTGDKLSGMTEELKGKLTHNPEKVQHGHDKRTGALKQKEEENDDKNNPFSNADDGKKDKEPSQQKKGVDKTNAQVANNDEGGRGQGNAPSTGITGKRGDAHPSEVGAAEQAATVAPEGTASAEKQRQGENTHRDRVIDEGGSNSARSH